MMSTSALLRGTRYIPLFLILSAGGCAARQTKKPDTRDTWVPEATQQESRELAGEQEAFMDDLSLSTSEQAGARHDRAVRKARNPEQEKRSK